MPTALKSRPDDNARVADRIRQVAMSLNPNPIDLRPFVQKSWDIIEPATPLLWNWHHELFLEHIEAAFRAQIKRLAVFVPPRSLKSNFVSILAPAWSWTWAPWKRMLFSSYSQSLSTEFSVKRRRVVKDSWYQENWGNLVQLAHDQDLKTEFENKQTGKMQSTSTGGTVTGKGGDIIIMDDPMNPKMAESEAERKNANEYYSNTLVSRLNDKKTGVIVLVMQRLHNDDTGGHVLKEGGWTHVDIQARADARRTYSFPISKREQTVELDEHLQPDREGEVEWQAMRKAMGSRAHDAQYQQRPSSETGNIWKKHWWKWYRRDQLPEAFDAQIQTWDMSFKDTEDGSYVVGQVWGLKGAKKFLLDQIRERMDFPNTKKAVRSLSAKWPEALAKLVEDKANGPAVIADLCTTIPGMIAVSPMGDKIVRAHAVSPTIEAGDCYLPIPEEAPWIEEYLNECTAFPDAPNDDQVDATSQGLVRLNELGGVGDGSGQDEDEMAGNFLGTPGAVELPEMETFI